MTICCHQYKGVKYFLHSIKTIIKHNNDGENRINWKVRYNGGFDDFMV